MKYYKNQQINKNNFINIQATTPNNGSIDKNAKVNFHDIKNKNTILTIN